MLNKLSFRSVRLAHISLVIIGVMWVLPFLDYRHLMPITTFYQEWETALLGVFALSLLLTGRFWQQVEIPRITLLPIGMLLVLLAQHFFAETVELEHTLLLSMYLLGAALIIILGHRLRIELGADRLALVLAAFLAVGAELGALVGILQHFAWHSFLDSVVLVKVSGGVFGNMAQPNQFADYTTLGLASIGLLYARWPLRPWQVAAMVTPLLFVLVLSASRSPWLYLSFMAAMSWWWQRRDPVFRPLMKYALWALLGFFLMQFVVQLPWLVGANGEVSTFDRMFGNVAGGRVRLYLWKEAALIFGHFPVLGAGFGQYALQHFMMGPELQDTHINGVYNNAHNLVMHVAAEAGLAGLAVLIGTFVSWLWHAGREPLAVWRWWGFSVLAVLGIHSMLEYPLWYAYFIGIAAIVLGMLEGKAWRLNLGGSWMRGLGQLALAAIMVFALFTLAHMYQGYKKFEAALVRMVEPGDVARKIARFRGDLLELHEGYAVLVRPQAEIFLAGLVKPDSTNLSDKLALNESAMRIMPAAAMAYREAWLLALADRLPEAKAELRQTLWAFPNEFPAAQVELSQWAQKDPARFSALADFAREEYTAYRSLALAGND